MSERLQFDMPNYVTIVKLQGMTNGNYCYVAFHPELPNIMSQGDTSEEAKENLVEATELTIAHLISNNLPVPTPMSFGLTNVSGLIINDLLVPEPSSFEFASSESSAAPSNSSQEVMTAPSGQAITL